MKLEPGFAFVFSVHLRKNHSLAVSQEKKACAAGHLNLTHFLRIRVTSFMDYHGIFLIFFLKKYAALPMVHVATSNVAIISVCYVKERL